MNEDKRVRSLKVAHLIVYLSPDAVTINIDRKRFRLRLEDMPDGGEMLRPTSLKDAAEAVRHLHTCEDLLTVLIGLVPTDRLVEAAELAVARQKAAS